MAFGIKKLLKKISPTEESAEESQQPVKSRSSVKSAKESGSKAQKASSAEDDATSEIEDTESKAKAANKSVKTKSGKKEEKSMTTQENVPASGIRHEYVEVAADLLAKPSALCDLVEAQGGRAVLVFCNNPSDTDFVEVILKKRGISAVKLIGFVAPEKLESTQSKVKSSDLAALVVTDVAARGLDFSLFPVIVNYSLPSDPDVYNTRAAIDQPGDRTAVSIVSPLDIANFHNLKTSTAFEFIQRQPPSKEDLAKAKLFKVKMAAQAKGAVLDPSLSELAKQIGKDSDSTTIIAYLLQNLFEVVPQLQSQVDKLAWERDNFDHENDGMNGQPSRDQRGNYDSRGGRGGRDRGQQGGRGGYDNRNSSETRGERAARGERNDGGRSRQPQRDSQAEGQEDNRHNGRRYEDRNEGETREDSGRRRREERRPPPPQKVRDDRLYIGKGEKDGLSQAEFVSLLKEHCGIEQEQLKRFLLRKNYAFADLPEGLGADVVQKLDGVESKAGSLYVAKATQVVTVIENQESSNDSENSDTETNFEGESSEEQSAV